MQSQVAVLYYSDHNSGLNNFPFCGGSVSGACCPWGPKNSVLLRANSCKSCSVKPWRLGFFPVRQYGKLWVAGMDSMFSEQTTFLISIALAVLGGLCAFLALRAFLAKYARRSTASSVVHAAFDVSTITPGLLQVRANYVAALHVRPHPGFHAKWLLEETRREVAQGTYFKEHLASAESG